MILNRFTRKRKGSVLILSLWTLALLSVFAVQIGLIIRQRSIFLSRLESRSKLRFIAEAGVKKAVSALKVDLERNKEVYTPYGKYYRHNNEETFGSIKLGDGICKVRYPYINDLHSGQELRYGFVDEESKININTADRAIIKRLIQNIITADEQESQDLVDAVIDWREFGKSETQGFYSQEYYQNLDYPYEPKGFVFEVLDELLLLKGFDQNVYDKLRPFITIYGDGRININTAPLEVLLSLGLDDNVAHKILLVRRGFDEKEATVDDYIFEKTFDIASEIRSFIELQPNEAQQIDWLNSVDILKTNSSFFSIRSDGQLNYNEDTLTITSIYNAKDNRIEYWREK